MSLQNKNKFSTLVFMVLMFVSFVASELYRLHTNIVMKVVSPTEFHVDLNGNRKLDDNETICLPDITSFSSDIKLDYTDLTNTTGLKRNEIIALGYLAEDFANKTLLRKNIKLNFTNKTSGACTYADIIVDDKSYSEMLTSNGFALHNYKPTNEDEFKSHLKEAHNLDLVILNHKNNKYHSPDCKYAHAASDTATLLRSELSPNATPCKVCAGGKKTIYDYPEHNVIIPTITTSGNIKVILTDYTQINAPNKDCVSNVCKAVVENIDSATSTIDMAIYGWESVPAVENSLSKAKERGVKIRVVTDEKLPDDNYYPNKAKLLSFADKSTTDLNLNSKAQTNMLMHNKFIIIDNKKVLTGSMNYSRTGLSGFNANNLLIINSNRVANLYHKEFVQMMSGKFHNDKAKTTNNININLDNTTVSVYFSPQDKAAVSAVVPLINNAQQYIYIPTFVLTHKNVFEALVGANKRGVEIKIIADATSITQRNSKLLLLRQNNIPVKTENFAGKMHMKTMIIDDKYVICGSMNFSNSGENKNDENLLVIKDKKLALFYKDYFENLWSKIPDKWLTQNAQAESRDSIGSCNDGVDNDHDGKVDFMDEGCK